MKKYSLFDLQQNVLLLDGTEATLFDGTADVKLSVREAFRKALNAVFKKELDTITFEQKAQRYEISKKIYLAEGPVSLNTDEQKILKDCVNNMYQGEALGFLNSILEGIVINYKKNLSNGKESQNEKFQRESVQSD
jgi:hypothetical protein